MEEITDIGIISKEQFEFVKIIFKQFVDVAFKNFTKERDSNSIEIYPNNLNNSIEECINESIQFASMINLIEQEKIQKIKDYYINLTYSTSLKKFGDGGQIIRLATIFKEKNDGENKISNEEKKPEHVIIVGDPGLGKTTTLKKICYEYLLQFINKKSEIFPIIIRFRDLSEDETLIDRMASKLGLLVCTPQKYKDDYNHRTISSEVQNLIINFYDEISCCLLLDGFDEISPQKRKIVEKELKTIFSKFKNSKIILSSRIAAWNLKTGDKNTSVYEVNPLTENQIKIFANKYFGGSESEKFLSHVTDSPYRDTLIKPLTLSFLCAIYSRYKKIDARPKAIYEKIVRIYLEDWDIERGIIRETFISDFDSSEKLELLSLLAFEISLNYSSTKFNLSDFSAIHEKLRKKYLYRFVSGKALLDDISLQTGLIVMIGFENYEFMHKTIHEYLTASYIIKMTNKLELIESKSDLSNELAVSVSLSPEPNVYFAYLVYEIIPKFPKNRLSISEFIARIEIEKPLFEPNLSLGVAFLYLIDHASQKKSLHFRIKLKVLQESLYLTLKHIESFEGQNVILRDSSSKLVEFKRLKKILKAGQIVEQINPEYFN